VNRRWRARGSIHWVPIGRPTEPFERKRRATDGSSRLGASEGILRDQTAVVGLVDRSGPHRRARRIRPKSTPE
jgi:hypothetical protein